MCKPTRLRLRITRANNPMDAFAACQTVPLSPTVSLQLSSTLGVYAPASLSYHSLTYPYVSISIYVTSTKRYSGLYSRGGKCSYPSVCYNSTGIDNKIHIHHLYSCMLWYGMAEAPWEQMRSLWHLCVCVCVRANISRVHVCSTESHRWERTLAVTQVNILCACECLVTNKRELEKREVQV